MDEQALWTWDTWSTGHQVGLLPGEETLTDMNLMSLVSGGSDVLGRTRRIKAYKRRDGTPGSDFLLAVTRGEGEFSETIVELVHTLEVAKDGSFPGLTKEALFQRGETAETVGAFPLCLFYNGAFEANVACWPGKGWGCVIAGALDVYEEMLEAEKQNFYQLAAMASDGRAFPWSEMLTLGAQACGSLFESALGFLRRLSRSTYRQIKVLKSRPSYVQALLNDEEVADLPAGVKTLVVIEEQ